MSRKNRAQEIYLIVEKGSIPFLPIGTYKIHVDGTKVEKGNINLSARVIETQDDYCSKCLIKKEHEHNEASYNGGIEHA